MGDIVLPGERGAARGRELDGDGRGGSLGQEDRNAEIVGTAAGAFVDRGVTHGDAHRWHAIAHREHESARRADVAGALQREQSRLVARLRKLVIFDAVSGTVAGPGRRAAQAVAAAGRVAGRPVHVLVTEGDVEVALRVDLLDAELEGVQLVGLAAVVADIVPCGAEGLADGIEIVPEQVRAGRCAAGRRRDRSAARIDVGPVGGNDGIAGRSGDRARREAAGGGVEGHAAVVVEIEARVVAAEEVDALRAEDRRQVDQPRRAIVISRERKLPETGGTAQISNQRCHDGLLNGPANPFRAAGPPCCRRYFPTSAKLRRGTPAGNETDIRRRLQRPRFRGRVILSPSDAVFPRPPGYSTG